MRTSSISSDKRKQSDYQWLKILNETTFDTSYLVNHRKTNIKEVMRIINLTESDEKAKLRVIDEVKML